MKLTKKQRSLGATFLGFIVAIANAWITIDWDNFILSGGNIMKLVLSAIIAAGGYFSILKNKDERHQNYKNENTNI